MSVATALSGDLIIPRPGTSYAQKPPVSGPSEKEFTDVFGTLLPPAQHVTTPTGRAAYYSLPPSQSTQSGDIAPSRVLLVHGIQTPALGMLPLANTLRASFPSTHFVVLDLWGHGLSDTPLVPHTPDLFFTLIDALLAHLSWPTVHLIGFSFGGATTVGYVATRAKRVDSFVLVAPAGLLKSSDWSPEARKLLSVECDDERAGREWVLDFLEGGSLVVPEDWQKRVSRGEVVAEKVREWQMLHHAGHFASVVAMFRDGAVYDNEKAFREASRTGVPGYAILGGDDPVCSEQDLKKVGYRGVTVVGGAGHGVVRDKPVEVAEAIGEFWTGLRK